MKKFFQKWFDKVALFILKPALITPEDNKRFFGVSTDDSVILDNVPMDRSSVGKDHVLATDCGEFHVLGIEDEDATITLLHRQSGVLHEMNLETFELLFIEIKVVPKPPENATTA